MVLQIALTMSDVEHYDIDSHPLLTFVFCARDKSAARLDFIVEPWYMSEMGKSSAGGAEFAAFRKELEVNNGIKFFACVEDVPPVTPGVKRIAIISAREYISLSGLICMSILQIQSNHIFG